MVNQTHAYVLAVEMTEEFNPAKLARVLNDVIPQLSKYIVKVEAEHIGRLDLYSDEGEPIDVQPPKET